MNIQKVTFKNQEDKNLSGRLALPVDRRPHNFVIFAHCFTCGKNLSALKNMSNALTAKGFGVLRFDFTGLGESDGEFSNTNISANVSDLIAAAKFLEEHHSAPSLLIGHSFGGAAIIFAAEKIPSVHAVATIASPASLDHITHLFKNDLANIEQDGLAEVHIGGRNFTIKKQFLDDIATKSLKPTLKNLRKPILILHSPQDQIVGIHNAEELYVNAFHPKSFISLDGADHLLSKKEDSMYAGSLIASWAKRYLQAAEKDLLQTEEDVVASLDDEDNFTTQMKVGSHYMTADEPIDFGGNNYGPSPYELISAGLSACTAMTLQMYAKRKNWPLKNVKVHTSYGKIHAEDCANCETENSKIDTFTRQIKINGQLDEKQIGRLLEIADKCPVHKTLHNEATILTNRID
ncbi:alpha/beta fold hydrolase [Arenibacter sp. 6A1]|uniref:bifunctional alpha/beta hydrolase/OsmC family protein n=1 Tax=Arenibacter sp. 6A1 TaxID=2720391 RepID=UPI001444C274|nr:bifunctional alpha/beta hydrolase/OsmC family protein [Arenibacter sp. 6A1]NKI27213.1 alpha/beta fold hydrolase [Arenibacter sp. 6A1]